MFISILGWFKGLTVISKAVLIIGGTTLVGATFTQNQIANTTETVETAKERDNEDKAKPKIENLFVEEEIPFSKKIIESDSLAEGETKITTAGVNGKKRVTYQVTKLNGIETSREKADEVVTVEPVEEVTTLGTYVAPPQNNCDQNYSPCVPNVSYDLDCPDIGFSVDVIGYDKHRFDRDGDGYGCESY